MLSEKPWDPLRTMLTLLCIGALVLFFSALEMQMIHRSGQKDLDVNSPVQLALMIMTIHGSVLGVTTVVLGMAGIKWGEAFGFSRPRKIRAVLLGLWAGAMFLPIGLLLKTISSEVWMRVHHEKPVEQTAVATLQNAEAWGTRACLIVFAVVIAPVAEEVLFRGMLYPAIKQAGFKQTALWGTAVLFAAIHMSPPIFFPLVVLGLALVWLYERTDNLLAPISAHAFFNAINVTVLYFGDSIRDFVLKLLHHGS